MTEVIFMNTAIAIHQLCSCENELQFATEMEIQKDDVSVFVDCTFADISDKVEC